MLTRITIQGLFGEIDYDLVLSEGPLTYIHAQNGFGKSTLMRLVCNLLQGNLEEVRTVPFQRLVLYFDNGSKLIVQNHNQELSVLMGQNRLEEELDTEDICKILNTVYIGPERLYLINGGGTFVPAIDRYMEELSNSIRKALSDSELPPGNDDGRDMTDADLDVMFKNIEAKLAFIKGAGFVPAIPSGFRFPPTRFEIGEKRDKYRALAFSLQKYVDNYYEFAESTVVYKDVVNSLFISKSVNINDKGFIQVTMDKSGTVIPLGKLSSGEKQILIIFYLLLFKTRPGSLVIIDEPEVSLHVSWQQQIGKYMKDIARVRDLKLIVSTHSPSVIHNDWDLAVELGQNKAE